MIERDYICIPPGGEEGRRGQVAYPPSMNFLFFDSIPKGITILKKKHPLQGCLRNV